MNSSDVSKIFNYNRLSYNVFNWLFGVKRLNLGFFVFGGVYGSGV